jgi:hypothetical protein
MSTIYVASKLPWDLECRVHRPEKYYEPSPMGPLERTRMIPTGATTSIRGVAYPFQPQPAFVAFRPAPQIFHGFAVTVLDGENAKNFCLWWQQNHNADEPNKSLPAIASGLLLWAEDLEKLKKKIRDQEPVMSGYESLNPNDDPRVPKSMSARVTQPRPTEEMADRLLPMEE